MSTTRKRTRNDVSDDAVKQFCESFACLLQKAKMQASRLSSFLLASHPDEMTLDQLIEQFKAIEGVSDFEVLLIELAIISQEILTVELIAQLVKIISNDEEYKDITTFIEAAKYDVYTAVQAHPHGAYASELLIKMKNEGVSGLRGLLESIESCVPETVHDNPLLYCHLVRYVHGLVVHGSSLNHIKRRLVESNAAQEEAEKVLASLECDAALVSDLVQTLTAHPVRVSKLNSEFNRCVILALENQEEKIKFIWQLVQADNVPLTMRQRYNLLSPQSREVVYPRITHPMKPIDKLLFDVEGEHDAKMVLKSIEQNKHLFSTGENIGDCCKAVVPHLVLSVMRFFLDEERNEKRIVTALGSVEESVVKAYLLHITPYWMTKRHIYYSNLIRRTAIYSDLEKLLIMNMENMHRMDALHILNYLWNNYDSQYIVYVLFLLPKELIGDFLNENFRVISALAHKPMVLRELFRVILKKCKILDSEDDAMLDVLLQLRNYNEWIRDQTYHLRDQFHRTLNHYLLHLPDKLKVAVTHGISRMISGIYTIDFLKALSCKNLYLTSMIKQIACDYGLTDILGLCEHIVKASEIVEIYRNDLAKEDILTLRTLVVKKTVTRKAVRECVLRCYRMYMDGMTGFPLSQPPLQVFLILLHQYAPDEFDKIIKKNFKRLTHFNNGYMRVVNGFPAETRMRVLQKAPGMCPANQLSLLLSSSEFVKRYKSEIFDYYLRTLERAEKRVAASYYGYLQAVYHLDEACFLDYCRQLSSLRKISADVLVGIGGDQVSRVNIMLAIASLITARDYTNIANRELITPTFGVMSAMLAEKLKPAVVELVRAELCDLQLAYVSRHTLDNNNHIENVVPTNAMQLGCAVGMLPADLQSAMMKRFRYLVSSAVDRDFVVSCCHECVKPEANQLFGRHPVMNENSILTSALNKIKCTKDMIHKLSLMHKSSRFEFTLECRRRFGNALYQEERQVALNFLMNVMTLLPAHYQRIYAGYYLHLIDTKEQAIQIGLIFEKKEEHADFIKQWEKFQQEKQRSVQRVKFVLFKPTSSQGYSEAEPKRKMRK